MPRVIPACVALVLAAAVCTSDAFARKGRDRKDDVVGAVWSYTLTRGGEKVTGKFRVYNKEIFKGAEKVGTVDADSATETTLVITGLPKLNGTARLRKTRRNPPGAAGTLVRDDGSEWQMKVRWKDG